MGTNNCWSRVQKRPLAYLACALLSTLVFICREHLQLNQIEWPHGVARVDKNDGERYTLRLDHCKAPSMESNPESYSENYKGRPLLMMQMAGICANTSDFSKLHDNTLFLTDETYKNCCVAAITRPWRDSSDDYEMHPNCTPLQNVGVDVSDLDFMAVRCDSSISSTPEYNFHANVPVNGRLKSKIDYWRSQPVERPYSVFVLVIDSTSRAEFFRSLGKTADFIVNNMNFVDFKGHHPCGEPTLFNAIPMLMGIQRSTFHSNYFRFGEDKFWDSSPFIWNAFKKLNYTTGFFEDDPTVGTFNYGGQRGFDEQPTTFYTRPLMLAHSVLTDYKGSRSHEEYCFGKRNVVEFMLDYHFETLKRLASIPTFQVTWPCWTQHDIGGSLSFLDTTYMNFFTKISEDTSILENTLIIVASDHGFKNSGEYPNSYHGLLERRSMPLFIRLPDRLRKENPTMMENLETNSGLITSHYDIYQTFLQIARMAGNVDPLTNLTTYGSSLLERIPASRTCKDARIPQTLCQCNILSISNNESLANDFLIHEDKFDIFE